MTDTSAKIGYARGEQARYLAELKDFLSIPSISTLSEHKPDIQRAAEWVAGQMRASGLEHIEILPTAGHPVVVGDWLHAPGKPTLLIYGHYDVQPVDPLNEWVSPPFEPTERNENLYARGASDMKGQVHAFLKALEAQINGLINALYAPTEQGAIKAQFARIKAQVASNRSDDAEASIVTFVQMLLGDLSAGDLQDPNGDQPPSTADALASRVASTASSA